jgi:hypothetical protein
MAPLNGFDGVLVVAFVGPNGPADVVTDVIELTPKAMLRLGIFGGKYMTDCRGEFPDSWFRGAKLCAQRHDAKLNCFRVNASQSLAIWRRNGWIRPQDPRGWFQW